MIFLSGFIDFLSQEDQNREAELYASNGWDLKDPSSHKVRIIIEDKDIDAFCEYIKSLPYDKKPRQWTDRNGETHISQTVSFSMKGSQLAGNYVKLRATLKSQQERNGGLFRGTQAPAQPARPPLQQQMPAPAANRGASPRQAYKAPQENTWNSAPLDNIDDEIPF